MTKRAPGLMDIGPLVLYADVAGLKIPVTGLSLEDVIELAAKYEPLRLLIEEGASALLTKMEPGLLLKELPAVCWSIMAWCTGDKDNEKAMRKAASLPLVHQLTIIEKIFDATFGREGVGPFAARVGKLTKLATPPTSDPTTEATTTTSAPSGKRSRKPSAASLHLELPPEVTSLSSRRSA